MGEYQGLPTSIYENGIMSIEYFSDAGPRIVRFSALGIPNLFTEDPRILPNEYGDFYFRGGHRLWHSPEAFPRTYIPDNGSIRIEEIPDGVRLIGSKEPGTGIAKTIEIQETETPYAIIVNHILRNEGLWKVELAPWALSMMRPGGVAILPQPQGNTDPDGLLNNRILALWPYTHIDDPRIILRDDFILIHAFSGKGPLKLGYFNRAGWVAYSLDGILFRKTFDVALGKTYPDGGCNTESYCCDQFLELEGIGPTTKIEPGGNVEYSETWEVYPDLNVPFISDEIRSLL